MAQAFQQSANYGQENEQKELCHHSDHDVGRRAGRLSVSRVFSAGVKQ
jgi:hypothetical protein